jgi:1-deoxy-D-xylulose-5-phosphate synthase
MAIRYPRGGGKMLEWQTPLQKLEIGRGEKLRDGKDLAIVSTGPIASEVENAIKTLEVEGYSVAHYDMTFIKPLDKELLREIGERKLPVITVEDATTVGGLGSAIEDFFQEDGFNGIRVKKIGVADAFIAQGTVAELRHICGMDAEGIAEAARNFIVRS